MQCPVDVCATESVCVCVGPCQLNYLRVCGQRLMRAAFATVLCDCLRKCVFVSVCVPVCVCMSALVLFNGKCVQMTAI